MKQSKLTAYIFVALLLGVVVGILFPTFGMGLKPFADIFLRMIKMIIAPLLFSTLVIGIAGHDDIKKLGRLGLKSIFYFEVVTTLALVIGLIIANVMRVGDGISLAEGQSNLSEVAKLSTLQSQTNWGDVLSHCFPTSIIDSMARGDVLQIVVFAVIFALALSAVGERGRPVMAFLTSLSEVMFTFTSYVMLFAPIGVCAAIAAAVGKNGIGLLGVYAKLILALYLALFLFIFLVLYPICRLARIPFWSLIKAIRDPILLAFSTASSEAALPKAMQSMERFGVPKNIVGFVMPTGYSFNLDGSTLYLSLATIFVAQMARVDLSVQQQILIMVTLMLTSKGVAGVPRVSLVILTGTLITFGLPIEGVAVILGIDHILDMGRTTVNLIGNCIATAVMARWEGVYVESSPISSPGDKA